MMKKLLCMAWLDCHKSTLKKGKGDCFIAIQSQGSPTIVWRFKARWLQFVFFKFWTCPHVWNAIRESCVLVYCGWTVIPTIPIRDMDAVVACFILDIKLNFFILIMKREHTCFTNAWYQGKISGWVLYLNMLFISSPGFSSAFL